MKKISALFLLICMLFTGCQVQPRSATVFCMDTVMELTLWGGGQEELGALTDILTGLEKTWSATDSASLLSRLNQGETDALSTREQALLEQIDGLSRRTGGAFDPHLYALSLAWGFYDGAYRVPSQEEIAQALTQRQWDLGGVLKGYAGQLCAEYLAGTRVRRAVLSLGGNIQTYGSKPGGEPWQIGIQDPEGGDPIALLAVTGTKAVVTSGDYQRYFEADGVRCHHILDPKTGRPADSGLRSVTVVCDDGMTADALSTALFVMGLEEGIRFWRESDDFEAVFLTRDGRLLATQGLTLSGRDYEVIQR